MFEKKRKLYENKNYYLLILSIFSDISIATFFIFFIFMNLWTNINSNIGDGIGFYWILGLPLTILVGIPSKLIDITYIKYIEDTNELKKHKLLLLHSLFSLITFIYWIYPISWFVYDIFSILT